MSLPEELIRLEQMRDRGSLSPEEFTRAKARLLDEPAALGRASELNDLRRSTSDNWIGGVCGGLAEYFDLDATLIRIVWLLLLLLGGTGGLAYIICWLVASALIPVIWPL